MSNAEGLDGSMHPSTLPVRASDEVAHGELRALASVGHRRAPGILIVDDHTLFAEAIGAALKSHRLNVLAIAGTAAEALRLVAKHRPELVLIDFSLPDIYGIQLGERILADFPGTKIVAVTAVKDSEVVAEAMRVGFHGYVLKDTPLGQFISTIKASMAGHVVVPHRLAGAAAGRLTPEERDAVLLAKQLTHRELQVLSLLADGRSGDEIGRALAIRANTVRTHVGNILSKLQVHSRLEAVTFAVRHRLVPGPAHHRRRYADGRSAGISLRAQDW